jgi:hypothetical protein
MYRVGEFDAARERDLRSLSSLCIARTKAHLGLVLSAIVGFESVSVLPTAGAEYSATERAGALS